LANRWAADEEEGRLELLLGTPHSRPRVMLARFSAVLVALLVVAGLLFTGTAIAAAGVGMRLKVSLLAQAAFGMVPVGLVVAAVGYLLSGWLRTAAVTGILIALIMFAPGSAGPFAGAAPQSSDGLLQFRSSSVRRTARGRLAPGQHMGLLVVAAAALAVATVRFAQGLTLRLAPDIRLSRPGWCLIHVSRVDVTDRTT
jgi:ABC-2 type transport system permease protein